MSVVVLAFWVVESLLGELFGQLNLSVCCGILVSLGSQALLQFFSSFYKSSRTYSLKSGALVVGDRGGTVLRVAAFRREILVGVHRLSVEVNVDCVPVKNDTVVSRKDTLLVDHSVVNLMEVVYL